MTTPGDTEESSPLQEYSGPPEPVEELGLKFGVWPSPLRQVVLQQAMGWPLRIARGQLIEPDGSPPRWLSPATCTLVIAQAGSKLHLRGCPACGDLMITTSTKNRCRFCTHGRLVTVRLRVQS